MRDDGDMTTLNSDVPAIFASGERRRHVSHQVRREVRKYLDAHLLAASADVAREFGLTLGAATRAMKRADEFRMKQLRDKPDAEKGRQLRKLQGIEDKALEPQVLRDKDGQPIYEVVEPSVPAEGDRPAKPARAAVVMVPPSAAHMKTAVQAMGEARKIGGLDAPTRSISEDYRLSATFDAELIRRIASTPEGVEALLKLEQLASEPPPAPYRLPAVVDVPPVGTGGDS